MTPASFRSLLLLAAALALHATVADVADSSTDTSISPSPSIKPARPALRGFVDYDPESIMRKLAPETKYDPASIMQYPAAVPSATGTTITNTESKTPRQLTPHSAMQDSQSIMHYPAARQVVRDGVQYVEYDKHSIMRTTEAPPSTTESAQDATSSKTPSPSASARQLTPESAMYDPQSIMHYPAARHTTTEGNTYDSGWIMRATESPPPTPQRTDTTVTATEQLRPVISSTSALSGDSRDHVSNAVESIMHYSS